MTAVGDGTTLEWFGTSTFRIRTKGLTIFFDAYLDRLPGLVPVGLSTREVDEADFVFVSHAHFDHLYGADAVASNTGCTIVASPESARCLRTSGVPEEQLLVVTGGETVDCGRGVRVRVLPALHACLFASNDADSGAECLGDLGLSAQTRAAKVAELFTMVAGVPDPVGSALRGMLDRSSTHDGGQLAFLLSTGSGSVLVSGSAGYWRGIFAGLRPDVAAERRRGAVPGFGGAFPDRAGQGARRRPCGAVPPRSAVSRISGGGHLGRGGRPEGGDPVDRVPRAGLRHPPSPARPVDGGLGSPRKVKPAPIDRDRDGRTRGLPMHR
jgi:L-ascorbate metabolism protein UlaG (beta-lactamase superfamily)